MTLASFRVLFQFSHTQLKSRLREICEGLWPSESEEASSPGDTPWLYLIYKPATRVTPASTKAGEQSQPAASSWKNREKVSQRRHREGSCRRREKESINRGEKKVYASAVRAGLAKLSMTRTPNSCLGLIEREHERQWLETKCWQGKCWPPLPGEMVQIQTFIYTSWTIRSKIRSEVSKFTQVGSDYVNFTCWEWDLVKYLVLVLIAIDPIISKGMFLSSWLTWALSPLLRLTRIERVTCLREIDRKG